MLYVVMPTDKNAGISYRVKCVVVESERLFGDVVITRQTRDHLCWMDSLNYPTLSRRKIANLEKKISEVPDFMALNTKPKNRVLGADVMSALPLADSGKNSLRKYASGVNGKNIDNVEREKKRRTYPLPMLRESVSQEVVVTSLVDQLLLDIYGYPRSERGRSESDSTASSYKPPPQHRYLRRARLLRKSTAELAVVVETSGQHVNHTGGLLIRQLRRRDYLIAKRDKQYDVITAYLQAHSAKRSEDTRMRFSLTPQPGESGFTQWLDAMKMVARLQGGIPQEFRKRLWLTLAERHLDQRGVDWKQAEKLCFNEWSNPDDEELGIQIVKDLHRTGCSLFCGAAGRDNQAVLRRVLLGFARWNKSVGYCQGLNVLAALVLQVTDRAESSAVKVMIYLIEGVLPEGYFADNLRGLSIDMAVFRDLLRMRLPKLSRHLEALQSDAKDKATGSSYEPPLTNVFTMQWFLTLFCHCLPQEAVLRVWDLIFLEGDEVLLRTALAIWEGISDRIMTVTSADEFYSIMGVLTREMLEFTDVNNLIKTIVNMGPLYGVTDLREKHRYNITPWARRLSDDDDTDTDEEERLAVAAAMFGVPQRFKKDRSNASSSALQTIGSTSDRERLALDISTLKHQYAKLRERQRQAHIILSAACARQSMVPSSTSQAMNHLLVGKSALVSVKTRQLGPPPGAIPPKPRATATLNASRLQGGRRDKQGVTLHWKDAKKSKDGLDAADEIESSSSAANTPEMTSSTLTSPKRGNANDSDSDSTSTELCDEPDRLSDVDSEEPTSTSDCYVMATDDEKSPRPGASPITGSTTLHKNSDKNNPTVKLDGTYLDVGSYGNDANVRHSLDVGETSDSIAVITDQIRRLSASEDHHSTPISNESETEPDLGNDDLIFRNAKFGETAITADGNRNASSVSVNNEEVGRGDSRVAEKTYETIDRYDFLISPDQSEITEKLSSPYGPLVNEYRDVGLEEFYAAGSVTASSLDAITDLRIPPSSTDERTPTERTPGLSNSIVGYQPIKPEAQERMRLKSTDSIPACAKYEDSSNRMVSSKNGQSQNTTNDLTYYSRSYVIGHLPISPTTVDEKLSRAGEISLADEKARISNVETFDAGPSENVESCGSVGNDGTGNPTDKLFSRPVRSGGDFETSPGYELSKYTDSSLAYGRSMSIDKRITDTLARFDIIEGSNDNTDRTYGSRDALTNSTSDSKVIEAVYDRRITDTLARFATVKRSNVNTDRTDVSKDALGALTSDSKVIEAAYSNASLPADSRNTDRVLILNCDLGQASISTESSNLRAIGGQVNSTRDEESVERPSVDGATSSRLSSDHVRRDVQPTKFPEDKRKRSPESGKSYGSGETMGPDSRNSSLATSPRSGTADSRTLPLSERSSSSSKTLTLRSVESEGCADDGTKFDTRSNVGPSLDRSSPTTPISTDSLKNKSEMSPKFVISSSSESCSPGKAKSSERSFSSELQSPVSADSIKYRTSHAEGQDNLSESPMDVCSATSPFYPIVNPNRKTPSPCGATGKHGANSDETSPERKSTSGRNERSAAKSEIGASLGIARVSEIGKGAKSRDEYDSGRPFEKELAETLSSLPCDRTKNEGASTIRRYKEDLEVARFRSKKTTIKEIEEVEERNIETDVVSPLSSDGYEARPMFHGKTASFERSTNERDDGYAANGDSKPFERRCSSLEKRFVNLKTSPSSDESLVDAHKKRSSDILQDIKHLEEKKLNDGKADTSMLTRKTGYVWEDLRNLEARRQDNFSDSASEFLRDRLEQPRIGVFADAGKSYATGSKVDPGEESDSILKSYARNQSNGESDDDSDSKLGVWTKVKPRAGRDSGRRSSDRALKIIQENSAILHKILTCQAKKRLPDLEEISKEITISPINEEISKIFSPILEKMGLNEHEISEELARINFKDFDQMTTASGSEFDAKINDELSKLSLIDDTEIVDPLGVEDVVRSDYLDTREALIDRQINEELSKLLANYEEDSPICAVGNREETASCKIPSEIEALDISSISTNVFSYPSSNGSIETKSDLDSAPEGVLSVEHFSQYGDDAIMKFGESSKYRLRGVSPTSDIDIYRELEKLDKISSGEILPSSSANVPQKIIPPISYAPERLSYPELRPSSPEYSAKPESTFERSPMKSPYEAYGTYDFKSRISPRKTPSNPYSARSYEKSAIDDHFEFRDDPTTPSRLYDLVGGNTRPVLSKETLEFRVRYDNDDKNESSKVPTDDDLSLQPYRTSLVNFDRGASYYSNEPSVSLKRLEAGINRDKTAVSPLNCSYGQSDVYPRKYDPLSPNNYLYAKNATDYEKSCSMDEDDVDAVSYLSIGRKKSHSLSPNYQAYDEREFGGSTSHPYVTELTRSLDDASKRSVSHSGTVEKCSQLAKYAETTPATSREAITFRKASLSLGPLDGTSSRTATCLERTPSPKSLFSPFPVRNLSRKPKELGLKLGLYSPSSPAGSNPLKRS